ncbi:hypothetical protein [Methyloglobulus morosus]|uniref:hypothetical protein n=1 Tax=Methyloglobulus morosus TaxID=1410681 RepID=UPI0003FD9495|nr:hypothetical protein [Methyloglobulus morosus]
MSHNRIRGNVTYNAVDILLKPGGHMLFVPTRNEQYSLRGLHETPQPPEKGGQNRLPT